MSLYKLFRPLLFKSDPESAHRRMAGVLKILHKSWILRQGARLFYWAPEVLVQKARLNFRTPLGIAAGFDKNAEFYNGLSALGVGFVELGSVTRYPQEGNPRPRIARLVKDRAIINHMGLNNVGLEAFIANLKAYPARMKIGVSIAPNHGLSTAQMISDMAFCAHEVEEEADYISFNLSCPNQDGVTTLQEPETIAQLLDMLHLRKPVFCKFSSDLDEEQLFSCLRELCGRVAGVILANTSLSRDGLQSKQRNFKGGLSGKPLFEKVLKQVKRVRKYYPSEFVLIFSGGIFTAEDAQRALAAGADLLQIYSGMIYEGPGIFRRIAKALR